LSDPSVKECDVEGSVRWGLRIFRGWKRGRIGVVFVPMDRKFASDENSDAREKRVFILEEQVLCTGRGQELKRPAQSSSLPVA